MGAILPRNSDARKDDTIEMREVFFHSFGYFWCHLLIWGPLNLCICNAVSSIQTVQYRLTYVMRLATCDLSQLLWASQFGVKSVTLLLRRSVLPIWTVRVTESSSSVVNFVTGFQLLSQGLARVEVLEERLGLFAPEDCTMLHSSTTDTFDAGKVALVLLQALQHEVHGIEPHADWGVDLALGRVLEDSLLDSILFLEVVVEGNLGLVVELEGRVNHDTLESVSERPSCLVSQSRAVRHTLELLRR